MIRRFLPAVTLLVLLATLAGPAQARPVNQPQPTALVYVAIAGEEDLARFRGTGLPAYTRPLEGFILTGADAAGQALLSQAGLSFRILDPDMAGATYYFAYAMPGRPAPEWPAYGRVVLDEGGTLLLRATPAAAERLALAGVQLRRLTFDPKPLAPAVEGIVFPEVITPDPLIQSMMDQVSSDSVSTYNRQLAGELPVWVDGAWYTISTRYTYSGTPIQKATSWVGQHFQSLGMSVEYHQWGGATYPNVIGTITGTINPNDIFIICAHIDDVQGTPGADDNGSGSTAVLIAADILSQYNWGCTLKFALWTGEEQGLLGSNYYAQRARSRNENIIQVLNLDMIAWNTIGSSPDIDLYARTSIPPSVQLAQLFADVVDAYDLNLVPQILTSGGSGSDNSSFWNYNYSAILGIEDNGDFNPYYHGSGDTPAHTDLAYFTEFVKAAVGTYAHASGCLIPGGLGYLDGHVTAAGSGAPIAGATVRARDSSGHVFPAGTDASGYYTRTLLADTYVITASHPQYESAVATGVVVFTDTVTTVDFALRPRGRLWGYVTDYDNGFPLAATLTSDDGLSAQSDPATGYYELYLDEGTHVVTATAADYSPVAASVNLVSGQSTRQDFRPRAQVSFIPKPVHVTLLLNTTDSAAAQVLNRRAGPYPFTTYEIAGGFRPGPDATWPGPDGFGYTGETVDFDWIEIRDSGTPITGLSDDSYAGPFNIGFTFPFYGVNQTQFYVSSNGFLSFGSGSTDYSNDCPLPNSATPNNIIAPMWDDLYPNYSSGGLYYQTFNSCPVGSGKCTVVEYYNWYHCCSSQMAGTFEAVLFDNGSVLMQFLDSGVEFGSGSTTAIEGNNAPGNHGLTYVCDTPNSLPDGLSICYIYPGSSGCIASDVPWLGEAPTAGTVPAGGSLNMTLFFTATAAAGVTQTGDYYATLVVNGSPRIRVPVTMTVVANYIAPEASFTSNTPACLGEEAVFTDTSNLGLPPADDFLWDFGDGITSTLRNPTHLYAQPGTYSVTLQVCNVAGCDTAEGVFVVEAAPQAGFTYSVSLLTAVFTNTSQNATAYLWDFGDGATSTAEHPTHTYAVPGLYTVTLTASQECGSDLYRAVLLLVLTPTASFTSNTPACLGEEAVFTDTSDLGFPPADDFLWDFGDGITSTLRNPTHLYAQPGTYSVTLQVCNAAGCDVAEDVFIVEESPQAGFTYAVDGLTVAFTDTSQNATVYLWDLGDGITSTLPNPVHTYAAEGTYTVTHWAFNDCGADIFVDTVAVGLAPEASFLSNAPVCLGEATVFTNTTTGSPPLAYLWAFGDGITSTAENPVHTYAAAGLWEVTLDAANAFGSDQATAQVEVLALPEAAFTYTLAGRAATFTNLSQNADMYLWDFGDGITSTLANPAHTYAEAGTYTVTLWATGPCGLDTATARLTVPPSTFWRIYLPLVRR